MVGILSILLKMLQLDIPFVFCTMVFLQEFAKILQDKHTLPRVMQDEHNLKESCKTLQGKHWLSTMIVLAYCFYL